jgi:hypothetical protein
MQIEKTYFKYIKKDAIASIGSDGLVGSVIINIMPGIGNSSKVNPGDIINSNKFGKDIGYYYIRNLAHMIDYQDEFYGEFTYPMRWINLTMPFYDVLKKCNYDCTKKYDNIMRKQSHPLSIDDVYDLISKLKSSLIIC